MKPPRTLGLQWSKDAIQRHLELVSKVLSNISFGQTVNSINNTNIATFGGSTNIQCWKARGTTPGTANTEFNVVHNLMYVPIGFIILSTAPAGHIYKSTTAWTAATNSTPGNIYLKSDVATIAFTIAIV